MTRSLLKALERRRGEAEESEAEVIRRLARVEKFLLLVAFLVLVAPILWWFLAAALAQAYRL